MAELLLDFLMDSNPQTQIVIMSLAVIGLFFVVKRGLIQAMDFYKLTLRSGKDLKKEYGSWAIVTGATDGIGKAYALGLAKKHKMNIVLISRTESKLQDVQKEVEALGVSCKYIVFDYSKPMTEDVRNNVIKKPIEGLDIGVLINNVGVSYRYPRYFHELPDEEIENLMVMNVHSTTWMTKLVLDSSMMDRKRGTIVNIGSASGIFPNPLLSQYSAAKSYIAMFTQGLNAEYQTLSPKTNITFQCQVPFFIATKLAKMRKSFFVPTPKEYVETAMKHIGYADTPVINPYLVHHWFAEVMAFLPEFLRTKFYLSNMLATRKKGLKKDAAAATKKE